MMSLARGEKKVGILQQRRDQTHDTPSKYFDSASYTLNWEKRLEDGRAPAGCHPVRVSRVCGCSFARGLHIEKDGFEPGVLCVQVPAPLLLCRFTAAVSYQVQFEN